LRERLRQRLRLGTRWLFSFVGANPILEGIGRIAAGLASATSAERDALRQWKVLRVIDRHRLAAHIHLPGIAATFPSAAGFLFATEGAADFGAARADVHVGDAAIAAVSGEELLGFTQIVCEDGRA